MSAPILDGKSPIDSLEECALFTLDANAHIASWNASAERVFGYPRLEVIGQPFRQLFLPEDQLLQLPERFIARARAQGRVAEEAQRIRKDGSRFWAEFILETIDSRCEQPNGFLVMVRDITEHRRNLRYSMMMVQLATNAMIMVDARGKLLAINPQTEKMFGYTASELLGESVEKLVPLRYQAEHPANREKYFKAPRVRSMGSGRELFAQRKNGTEFPVEIGLNPVESDQGLVVIGSIVDITERKRLESESRRLQAEATHAARLSTVGQMISGLAHEINQPLAAAANCLRGCIRLSQKDELNKNENLIQWLELAASQTTRACEIVSRLGVFVKKSDAQRKLVDVNQLIEQSIVLSTMTFYSGKDGFEGVNIQTFLEPHLPFVAADRVQIQQVLINLIRNGAEAMCDTPFANRHLIIRSELAPNSIRVSVEDRGAGIPPDQLPRLFEAFFTTKQDGVGLGLSISRSIIDQHRGELSVSPASPRGTIFSFTLPTCDAEAYE